MRKLSKEQFEEKYYSYKDMIYNITYTYTLNSDDSMDLVQDIFMKYLNEKRVFKTLDDEKYWLIRVSINTSINFIRTKWKKSVVLANDYVNDYECSNQYQESKNEKDLDMFNMISKLPSKYKIVIILYYYEDNNLKDISNTLNISLGCAKKRLQRAKKILKEKMEDNNG